MNFIFKLLTTIKVPIYILISFRFNKKKIEEYENNRKISTLRKLTTERDQRTEDCENQTIKISS